jgi:hypothetical protein
MIFSFEAERNPCCEDSGRPDLVRPACLLLPGSFGLYFSISASFLGKLVRWLREGIFISAAAAIVSPEVSR